MKERPLKYKARVTVTLTCGDCGNSFQATRVDSKYCSDLCQKRAYRKANKYKVAGWEAERRRKKVYNITQSPIYAPKIV